MDTIKKYWQNHCNKSRVRIPLHISFLLGASSIIMTATFIRVLMEDVKIKSYNYSNPNEQNDIFKNGVDHNTKNR